jgi:hypothetical protein
MRYIFHSILIMFFAFAGIFATQKPKPFTGCVTELDNLITVTGNVTSLSTKDKQGLTDKAVHAKDDYLAGKTEDVLLKLNDYQVKLVQLEATLGTAKPKISVADDQAIKTALNGAITCISSN